MALNAKQILDICIDIRGTLTLQTAVTGAIWDAGASDWDAGTSDWDTAGAGAPAKIVFQRAPKWAMNHTTAGGKKIQIRRHVIGLNPQTIAQQANRQKMVNALAYWRDFNIDARAKAAPEMARTGRSAYNSFMKLFMNNLI